MSSIFVSISAYHPNVNAQVNTTTTSNNVNLNQYEWAQFQGDSSFTRFSTGPAPSTSSILWKANVTGIQPYLAAFNGLVFVCTSTSVVALDQTGKAAWQTTISMNGTWPIAYKIDNSHMIVENSCLDPQTGKLLWASPNFTPDTGIFTANVYSPEQKMFYVKSDSYIQAWDFSNPSKPPTLAWHTYIPGGGKTGIGTTYGGGMVFVGSFENQQIALNATTGAIIWDTPTKGPMIFNGAYSDGRFFRGGTDDNTLYCFDATNGQILWNYTAESGEHGYFVTGPAIAYGMVYEMNKDGYLYSIDVKTGNLVWKYKGPDDTLLWPGMPAVADGKVYVTTGEIAEYGGQVGISQFSSLDAYTGKPIWTLPIEALAPRESIAIAYGKLYIIPGTVTSSVDSISGSEYSGLNQIWCIGASSVVSSDWPMWRATPAHSSAAQFGPSNLTLNWKFATNGSVISSPSVANGIVYFGSQDKKIYAVGAWSGSLIWSFPTNDAIESSPAVANGKVYTGGDDGNVYCLDAYSGALLWKTFINGDLPFTYNTIVLKSSPVVAGGNVYVGSLDNYMYALNANNGDIIWKTKTNGPIESSPAFDNGSVFFVSQEPAVAVLYKLDANNGEVIWTQPFPYEYQFQGGTELLGSPSIADGMVFTSSNLRSYYAVNEATGNIVWNFTDPDATEFIISAPIYVNGQLFIIDKFNIACLNAKNGHTIWSYFTGDELTVSPSYADGKIYVVTSQRHIYVLDTTNNGTKIDTVTTPSSSWSSPSIANGRLYVGCNDWNLYSFSNSVNSEANLTPTNSPNPPNNFEFLFTPIAIIILAAVLLVIAVIVVYVLRKQRRQ